MTSFTVPDGYTALAPGKLASIVTSLEMRERPKPAPQRPLDRPLLLERFGAADAESYRALFRAVGQEWLWFSRLALPVDALTELLGDPRVEAFAVTQGRRRVGILELDFRQEGECELVYFGLTPEVIGQGLGRWLMQQALTRAWARPISRIWVHTCTLDGPAALSFYIRSGFRPFARLVEVSDDPRLIGLLPREAAPHIPIV